MLKTAITIPEYGLSAEETIRADEVLSTQAYISIRGWYTLFLSEVENTIMVLNLVTFFQFRTVLSSILSGAVRPHCVWPQAALFGRSTDYSAF